MSEKHQPTIHYEEDSGKHYFDGRPVEDSMPLDNSGHGEDAELRGKLDQLWGWAKAGKGDVNYLMAIDSVDSFTDTVMKLIKARDELRERPIEALRDIIVHAAPDGTQDDGEFIGFYVLPTGPVHRGLVALQAVGQARETMGDVAVISRYQAHLEQREREIRLDEGCQIERLCHENGPYVGARELTYADFMLARDKRIATLTPRPKK
ncbi:hypothetical protein AB0280_17635 [Pseudarthrobacter sp902506025]|uniref:hypothetical protein n=1 Tax=Pseudarthrobacter sp. 902506025 TaxID=3155291 RepID=UPI00344F6C3F